MHTHAGTVDIISIILATNAYRMKYDFHIHYVAGSLRNVSTFWEILRSVALCTHICSFQYYFVIKYIHQQLLPLNPDLPLVIGWLLIYLPELLNYLSSDTTTVLKPEISCTLWHTFTLIATGQAFSKTLWKSCSCLS